MSFKLQLFQLGFTCITAADKLRFILSDSEDIWSFQAAAPYLWNRLPHEIRMIKCLDKFKKAIKTFLFNEAFCNH